MLGEPSRVALITTSFGSIEASGIGISGVQLGRISVKSCVCAFSYYEMQSKAFERSVRTTAACPPEWR